MKTKILKGRVWSGFAGEYKKPPVYIITKLGINSNGEEVFIDDVLKKFIMKDVKITIEEVPHTQKEFITRCHK